MNKQQNKRATYFFMGITAAIFIAAVVSVCIGKYSIALSELLQLIVGDSTVPQMTQKVFYTLRIPRTVMAILTGVSLGFAGSVYQTIFKNPLASPDIIGVAGGANLGAAAMIVSFSSVAMTNIAIGSFLGAFTAVLSVMALVKLTKSHSTATYILSGIVINAISKTLIMILKYFADPENELATMEYWEMGTLGNITATKVLSILPFFLVGFLGLILFRRQIELMELSDYECQALGVRIKPIRTTILLLSTLLVSSVISVTGLISFVGLIAPHIARLMLKRNNTVTLFLSSLVGAFVVLFADILARTLYSAELPISILTTLIGVPMLIYFMCKKGKGRVF